MEITSASKNRFVILFHHPLDLKHALEGCPWLLERHAVILCEILEDQDPLSVELHMLSIVVQIHHMPYRLRSKEVAEKVKNHLGEFVEYLPPKRESEQSMMRIKVRIDIRKWIGHLEKKCPKRYEEDFQDLGTTFEYGPWLSASFPSLDHHSESTRPTPQAVNTSPSTNRRCYQSKFPSKSLPHSSYTPELPRQPHNMAQNPPTQNWNTENITAQQLDNHPVMSAPASVAVCMEMEQLGNHTGKKRSHVDDMIDETNQRKRIHLGELDLNSLSAAKVAVQPRRSQ
ncbi:hypothetical protein CDL12_20173 [Handroanthus impetiginosus]|uniref:Uncharacterized protein n=1 Tax=Handroanthus impetiginosus TaxID=429701 RepID=A0A2G9GPN4_9LAMI|nr:hypothetical protein CDL12_20173 [Handroanthus impetiginosus]